MGLGDNQTSWESKPPNVEFVVVFPHPFLSWHVNQCCRHLCCIQEASCPLSPWQRPRQLATPAPPASTLTEVRESEGRQCGPELRGTSLFSAPPSSCYYLSADGSAGEAGDWGLGSRGLEASVSLSCCEHRTVSDVGLVFRAPRRSWLVGPKHSLTPAGVQLKTHRVSDVPGRVAVLSQQGQGLCPQGSRLCVHSAGDDCAYVWAEVVGVPPGAKSRKQGLSWGLSRGPLPPKSQGLQKAHSSEPLTTHPSTS